VRLCVSRSVCAPFLSVADNWSSGPDWETDSSFFSREKAQKTQKHVEGGMKGRMLMRGKEFGLRFVGRVGFFALLALFHGQPANTLRENGRRAVLRITGAVALIGRRLVFFSCAVPCAVMRIAGAMALIWIPARLFLAAKMRKRRNRT